VVTVTQLKELVKGLQKRNNCTAALGVWQRAANSSSDELQPLLQVTAQALAQCLRMYSSKTARAYLSDICRMLQLPVLQRCMSEEQRQRLLAEVDQAREALAGSASAEPTEQAAGQTVEVAAAADAVVAAAGGVAEGSKHSPGRAAQVAAGCADSGSGSWRKQVTSRLWCCRSCRG